jgi:hypothetical protein
MQINTSSAA